MERENASSITTADATTPTQCLILITAPFLSAQAQPAHPVVISNTHASYISLLNYGFSLAALAHVSPFSYTLVY
jgi:hypothetical protein